MKSKTKTEYGDFQTPPSLAREVCQRLGSEGINADIIIEPTCGQGSFLSAAAEYFPKALLRGWDINPAYVSETSVQLGLSGVSQRASLEVADFFAHDWEAELQKAKGKILILGNPPWVTSAAVSAINGTNLPAKENFLGLRGIAARTGKSNFDISESILIRLIQSLRGREATIAMLCKTSTARKVLRYAWRNDGRIAKSAIYRIDAKLHFEASVDACLLLAQTGLAGSTKVEVFDSLGALSPSVRMGMAGADLVADIDVYEELKHLEGFSPFQWRSGIKHDCASVMELTPVSDGLFENKFGEQIILEPDYVFPLLKCTDLAHKRTNPRRYVIVTQRRVGDDTSDIAQVAPLTWRYLESHRSKFEGRKSSIYKNQATYALFGIGEYAFAPWKVAISGLHQDLHFQVVGPVSDRPVFMDDTCYYLSFEQEHHARIVAGILNSKSCRQFLDSLIFKDVKRPVTVEVLQRLSLSAIAEDAGLGDEWGKVDRTNYRSNAAVPQYEFIMDAPRSRTLKSPASGISEAKK